MLQINTLHIIEYPTHKYGYVGKVPADLFNLVPATPQHIMGGRYLEKDGVTFGIQAMGFDTKADAIAFAESKGYEVANK